MFRSMLYSTLLVCCTTMFACAHQAYGEDVIFGSFTWPDRGVRVLSDPNEPDQAALVFSLAAHTDGKLYVGGYFNYAGEFPTQNIATWDGQGWIPIGANGWVNELRSDPSGLYAGGDFSVIGGAPAARIGRWDGAAWQPLGAGVNGTVVAIHVYAPQDGPPIVYAGGDFTQAGGQPANRVGRWDGATWSGLGAGCSGSVQSLVIADDVSGSGPALFATGFFQKAGGIIVNRIAKWDIQSETWSPLGQGITQGFGRSLAVFNDSHDPNAPPALFLGGNFTDVDGKPIVGVARWDGQTWSAVGEGPFPPDEFNTEVFSLRVLNDGHGDALYAFGAPFIKKWDGQSWATYANPPGGLWDGEVFNDQLHVGGGFTEFIPKIARFTSAFGCGDFNHDGVTDQKDLGLLLTNFGQPCPPGCDGDTDYDGDVDQSDLGTLLAHWEQQCG